MAVVSGYQVDTGRSYSDVPSGSRGRDVSQREDLANFISMLTRDETPFMSSIGKTKATAIYQEWQTDQLNSPGNSRTGEGTDYRIPTTGFRGAGTAGTTGGTPQTFDGPNSTFAITGPQRSRLGNYTQINGKTIAVSGTRRAIDQAGVADEYAYQLKKRGTELRRDIEFDLIHQYNVSQAAAEGQSFTPGTDAPAYGGGRSFGGYQAWINQGPVLETDTSLGGNCIYKGAFRAPGSSEQNGMGTNAGLGTHTVQRQGSGDPARAPLALSDIDLAMQRIYQNGGKANKLMLSPKLRRDFSDLMVTDSGVRRNIDMDGKLRQSVDVYMSDFGDVMVIPNYIMGLTNSLLFQTDGTAPAPSTATEATDVADFAALLYDPMWFSIATLRPLQEVDVGQRGDSTIGMMIEECTLEVKNPSGCSAIYGLI